MIICPPKPLPTLRWLWKPEFFDVFAEVDELMVERGCYLVYLDLTDHYGCPKAVAHGDALHEFLVTTFGFNSKVSFIALSRGGLFAYNWAVKNPHKVGAIYADNPVCDFKSWPAGWGEGSGSSDDWNKCLAVYGLTEAEARAYRLNPIDHLESLAAAEVPIFHVIGQADEIVPVAENSDRVRERYKSLGGNYTEIVKPLGKHHPHGLLDPSPIVEFLERHG